MGHRRVGIGKLGEDSGTAKWGIRVSRVGHHAVPTDHDDDIVSIDELAFDSLNPVGHFPIYRIYDVTVAAASGLPLIYVGLPMLASLSVTHGFFVCGDEKKLKETLEFSLEKDDIKQFFKNRKIDLARAETLLG